MLSINPSEFENSNLYSISGTNFQPTYPVRSVSKTLSFVTHDIRNLLTVIALNAEKLLHDEHQQQNRIGNRILKQVDQITAICAAAGGPNNSDRAKPYCGPVTPVVMIAETLSDVIKSVQKPNSNVLFEVDCETNHCIAMCRSTLFRILYNIVSNAAEALSGQNNSKIRIVVTKEFDQLCIDIIDNGPGLPSGIKQALTSNRIDKSWGGGLGVLIANMLLHEHSGGLKLLDSTSQGTHFRIAFKLDS